MNTEDTAHEVAAIKCRRIWNSHLNSVPEFCIILKQGNVGVGASPQGETISIYEDKTNRWDAPDIIDRIRRDGVLQSPLTQRSWDEYLHSRLNDFGRNNCWALSLAFFNAANYPPSKFWPEDGNEPKRALPRLCLNVLNGGAHAYTNPVLSDFPEFLLVPTHDDFDGAMRDHANVQELVRERLSMLEFIPVNHNWVHRFETRDNRECLDFLSRILDGLNLTDRFTIMIDASAGDLYQEGRYTFPITDHSSRTTDELLEYWQGLQKEYHLGFLEDPFAEEDYAGWSKLTRESSGCLIIGDNFYSSDAARIEKGACENFSHGAIVKPNQAGSVTAVEDALRVCREKGLVAIASHRSISTESVFLSTLTMLGDVRYMKIGPLQTDYSSVLRLNELIRLSGEAYV